VNEELFGYIRTNRFPFIWCPGCGNGVVLHAMVAAIHKLGLPQNEVCIVSGIGCSSRVSAYVDFNTVHTTHGRALTFATGIKMAKPHLHVFVVTGDGDATAIGGNHYIHAARRNIDLNVLLINNYIYGMTGGQVSPTTPQGMKATTAPFGQTEANFNISGLAGAAGASFVARTTTFHPRDCERYIRKAVENKGFSLVEFIAACPTSFGRQNKQGSFAAMMQWQGEAAVPINKAKDMTEEELIGKVVTGVFVEQTRPECRAEYQKLIDRFHPEEALTR
jgi:2-oxoglutarate/2-oxoacid ferredoxin oxidoreductase subunit beta